MMSCDRASYPHRDLLLLHTTNQSSYMQAIISQNSLSYHDSSGEGL